MRFALPSAPEQRKIAAFLSAVDARIALVGRERAGLARFKAGLLQALFSRALRFAPEGGGAFPEWEERRLGEVFRWVRTNSLSREHASAETGEVQNIHYGDVHGRFRAMFRQSQEAAPYFAATVAVDRFSDDDFCRVGDVIIADASEDLADIGKAIEVMEVRERSLVAGLHTILARPRNGAVVSGFMAYLLTSPEVRRQIVREAQGVSVYGLSKTSLEGMRLPLPHPDEQTRIAAALSALDRRLDLAAHEEAALKCFKAGLLQAMFV